MFQFDSKLLHETLSFALRELPEVEYLDAHYLRGSVSSGGFRLDNYLDSFSARFGNSVDKEKRAELLRLGESCLHIDRYPSGNFEAYAIVYVEYLLPKSNLRTLIIKANGGKIPPKGRPVIYSDYGDSLVSNPSEVLLLQEVFALVRSRVS